MITADELEQLMQRAMVDKMAEPDFFRALLEATVYAHIPRDDRSGRLRFIQFTTPDGQTVLPFFSDEAQVRAAAGSAATVVVLTGRQLFELTRGATLMLNPNSTRCTLYPEEIATLLDRGEVTVVDKIQIAEAQPMVFREPDPPPAWLIDPLIALYARLPSVEAAYLLETGVPGGPEPMPTGLLIALDVPSAETERAARATITTIQPLCRARDAAVDLTVFVPDALPDWVRVTGVEPFYSRTLGQRLVTGSTKVQ